MSTNGDARHPVRVVCQQTGLTPATLRAWERRYGVVDPSRSEGGQRLYTDAEVERLRVLRALADGGRPIRLIAPLSLPEARALLAADRRARSAADAATPVRLEARVAEALALTRVLDADGLQASLRRAAVTAGATSFLDHVVAPLLAEVGEALSRGEMGPAQEHLASEVVDSLLAWLTESATESERGPGIVVVTLPGELHRLGARLVAAASALEGWRVTYLGSDLPPAEIARAAAMLDADAVAVSVVNRPPTEGTRAHLRELRAALPASVRLLLGGSGADALLASEGRLDGVLHLPDLAALRAELRVPA